MPSTRPSKPSPPSSSSASPERRGAKARLEALLQDRLGSQTARIASEVAEILVAEGWTPPPERPEPQPRAPQPVENPVALPAATALFDAARTGGAEAVRGLIDLPTETLRRLISELGYDPSRRTRKWKDRERLSAFIADETVKRVRRNRAFGPPSSTDSAAEEFTSPPTKPGQ